MFLRRFRLCTLFGIAINVDASWLVLAALIARSLGGAAFPGLRPATYWVMAAPAALVPPGMSLMAASRQPGRSGESRLMVVEGGHLKDLLSSRDILNELMLRQELAAR